MPRNITTAQKRARDFHKSDALSPTIQIKYDCFFFSHDTENKNPGQVFLDFVLFFNTAVEKF